MVSDVSWQNIGQKSFVVCLQVFHLFFLLGRLQFPEEVQPVGGLGLVAMYHQSHHKHRQDPTHQVLGSDVLWGHVPENEIEMYTRMTYDRIRVTKTTKKSEDGFHVHCT